MMMSVLMALEGMLLLAIVQHDKALSGSTLSPIKNRFLKLLGSLFLLCTVWIWSAYDGASMGFSHAIILMGLLALVPVFMLTFCKQWLQSLAVLIPVMGIILELFSLL